MGSTREPPCGPAGRVTSQMEKVARTDPRVGRVGDKAKNGRILLFSSGDCSHLEGEPKRS